MIVLVDYNGFFHQRAEDAVPDRLTGKFVQIRNGETEYLIFATKDVAPYHADLLEKFCEERGIPGMYVKERKRYDIHDPDWVIVGGGKFEIDKGKKSVLLYDDSMAYGRFAQKGLREKIQSTRELAGYTVKIM